MTRTFVDTNVLAYVFDHTAGEKCQSARRLLAEHDGPLVISTQVMLELFSVLVRKLGFSNEHAREAVHGTARLRVVPADQALVQAAAALVVEHGVSIYDAMLVSAAVRDGCDVLLTEDAQLLQADFAVETRNPFA